MKNRILLLIFLILPINMIYANLDTTKILSCDPEFIVEDFLRQYCALDSSLKEIQNELKGVKKMNEQYQLQISDAKDLPKIKKERDSLLNKLQNSVPRIEYDLLEKEIESKQVHINKLDSSLSAYKGLHEQNKPKAEYYEKLVLYLDSLFSNSSVDQLYGHFDKEQLLLWTDLYDAIDKTVPGYINELIECIDAQQQCHYKYNKIVCNQKITNLQRYTSQTSVKIIKLLQTYSIVYFEANTLWNAIKKEVYAQTIEGGFAQYEAKITTWQHTQKFLNKYPNLVNEYPYIYNELQKMLQEIWKDANNFNKIPNPFQ